MKTKDLFSNSELLDQLRKNPPASKFSGKPLSLTSSGDGLHLYWENCMEPDWWVGAQDGVYTRQDRRPVTDDEILAAASAAGLDTDLVGLAFASREIIIQNQAAERAQERESSARGAAIRAEQARVQTLAMLADREPTLTDAALAAAAERELGDLLTRFPHVVKMTRKLALIDSLGTKLALFTNLAGMRAWLYQHGISPSIDNRHAFMESLQ